MPIALEMLRKNPLAEGDFFEGDLLLNVVRAEKSYFKHNPKFADEIVTICQNALKRLQQGKVYYPKLHDELEYMFSKFIDLHSEN